MGTYSAEAMSTETEQFGDAINTGKSGKRDAMSTLIFYFDEMAEPLV